MTNTPTWTVVVCGDTYRVKARDIDAARSAGIACAIRAGRTTLREAFTDARVIV